MSNFFDEKNNNAAIYKFDTPILLPYYIMNLGMTIKNLRKKKGLKQNELASNVNITQTYLSQIENNIKEPNLSTLKLISEGLGVPMPIVIFLSMDENDIHEQKREIFKIISPTIKSLIEEFSNGNISPH